MVSWILWRRREDASNSRGFQCSFSTPRTSSVNTGGGNKNIIYKRKNALTTNPRPILVLDLTIAQYSSLVQLDSSAMDLSCKRNLIRVEVLPARLASHFVRQIAQNILHRIGDISDPGIERQIMNGNEDSLHGLVVATQRGKYMTRGAVLKDADLSH